MRAFLTIFLACVMSPLPSAAETGQHEWLTSVDLALTRAAQREQRILVDLYADWCGWCKRLEEEVFSSPTFQEFARDLVLLRVDTEDGAEGSRLQERFEAFSLPTTLILDAKLSRIAKVEGFAPAAQYVATIQRELAAFDELLEGYERFGRSEDLRVLGILADEFHQRNDGERAANLYHRMMAIGQLPADQSVRIHYQLTDALRLAADYDEARVELDRGRQRAQEIGDTSLIQRFDLLAAQITLERGDCDGARLALEDFLGTYPSGYLVQAARRTLRTLNSQGYRCI